MVEHNNKFVKEMIANQIANVSFDSSQLVSRASEGIEAVLTNIDLSLRIESGNHAKVDKKKDVYTKSSSSSGWTEYCPGRAYKAFPTMETVRQPASVFTWARSTSILHPGAIHLKWARPPMDIQFIIQLFVTSCSTLQTFQIHQRESKTYVTHKTK